MRSPHSWPAIVIKKFFTTVIPSNVSYLSTIKVTSLIVKSLSSIRMMTPPKKNLAALICRAFRMLKMSTRFKLKTKKFRMCR